jgi:glucose-6-phosphate isomerase
VFVFDNVDPAQFASFLSWVDDKLDKTIFNVISKSGRTAETASQLMIVSQLLMDKLGPEGLRNQVVATTDANKGTLRKIATEANLRCLEVPDGVGGRFSVLSAVGLFSAAMCGIDIDGLLAGAREMDARVSREDFKGNPAALNAAINYHYYIRGKRNSVIMPYSDALKDMADWYRQLWAESLGKNRSLAGNEVEIGPTPVKALGATDQHSQVQLYREGPNDKLFTFLQVNNFDDDPEIGPAPDCAPELRYLAGKKLSELLNNEKKATEYALLESKRPCLTVLFDRVNAYAVGQFIYLFEVTTSIAGALFNINPYDQPAVELGKEATFALMGKDDCEDFAQTIQKKTEIDEALLV